MSLSHCRTNMSRLSNTYSFSYLRNFVQVLPLFVWSLFKESIHFFFSERCGESVLPFAWCRKHDLRQRIRGISLQAFLLQKNLDLFLCPHFSTIWCALGFLSVLVILCVLGFFDFLPGSRPCFPSDSRTALIPEIYAYIIAVIVRQNYVFRFPVCCNQKSQQAGQLKIKSVRAACTFCKIDLVWMW